MNKTYITIAIIIGVSILGFGYMTNQQKQKQIEYEAELTGFRMRQLNGCLDMASQNYQEAWTLRVSQMNRTDKLLPAYASQPLEDERNKAEELCVKKFK
jgi:hypothetical protein